MGPRIEKITLWYHTSKMLDVLLQRGRFKPALQKTDRSSVHSIYSVVYPLKEVNPENLARHTYEYTLRMNDSPVVREKSISPSDKRDNIGENTIYFAGPGITLRHAARDWFSLILFCPAIKSMSALHVQYAFQAPEMYRYAFWNLKKLAGDNEIHAYLGGRFIGSYGRKEPKRVISFDCSKAREWNEDMQVTETELFLQFLVPAMIKDDVIIKDVNLGGNYGANVLDSETGEHNVEIEDDPGIKGVPLILINGGLPPETKHIHHEIVHNAGLQEQIANSLQSMYIALNKASLLSEAVQVSNSLNTLYSSFRDRLYSFLPATMLSDNEYHDCAKTISQKYDVLLNEYKEIADANLQRIMQGRSEGKIPREIADQALMERDNTIIFLSLQKKLCSGLIRENFCGDKFKSPKPISASELLNDLSLRARLMNMTFTLRSEGNIKTFFCSEDSFLCLFLNLLKNSKTARAEKIDLEIKRDGKDIVITFADDGKGIDESLLVEVEDPDGQKKTRKIFTGLTTKTEDIGYHGIGMSSAYERVAQLGGSIEAMNRQGSSGAIFVIRIPDAPIV